MSYNGGPMTEAMYYVLLALMHATTCSSKNGNRDALWRALIDAKGWTYFIG